MAKEIQTTNYTFKIKDDINNVGDLRIIEPVLNKINNGDIGNIDGIIEMLGVLNVGEDDKETVIKEVEKIGIDEFQELSDAIGEIFESIEKKKDKQNK